MKNLGKAQRHVIVGFLYLRWLVEDVKTRSCYSTERFRSLISRALKITRQSMFSKVFRAFINKANQIKSQPQHSKSIISEYQGSTDEGTHNVHCATLTEVSNAFNHANLQHHTICSATVTMNHPGMLRNALGVVNECLRNNLNRLCCLCNAYIDIYILIQKSLSLLPQKINTFVSNLTLKIINNYFTPVTDVIISFCSAPVKVSKFATIYTSYIKILSSSAPPLFIKNGIYSFKVNPIDI